MHDNLFVTGGYYFLPVPEKIAYSTNKQMDIRSVLLLKNYL